MTPSCDNPSCSYLPLSDNISDALKKSTYLIEQPLPILFVLKESWRLDNNLCVCLFSFVPGVRVSVLNPCQAEMHYLRCCCDTCACLKVSASFLTPCRISPPLPPLVGGNQSGTCWHWSTHHLGKYHSRGRKGNDIDNLLSLAHIFKNIDAFYSNFIVMSLLTLDFCISL